MKCPIHKRSGCYCDERPNFFKRKILHVRDCDRKWLDEYCRIYVKTIVLPKRISKEGQAEFYRHVILGRLQNRTLKDIATEHGISVERVRQIFSRFKRFCDKKGHSLERK